MAVRLEVRADLDPPGETGRQARVLAIWIGCLALAVSLVIAIKPSAPPGMRESSRFEEDLEVWRSRRLRIAAGIGIALPALLTLWATRRRRRGGPHARGIVVDVTDDGELRLWGRGYGQRVLLQHAEISERLVDVYLGRLGAWRQRRLRVRPKRVVAGSLREIELATLANDTDLDLELRLEGGEGDCVELRREDYIELVRVVREVTDSEERAG